MSEKLRVEAHQPVSFGERLANSQAFSDLFRDGMSLVEETATYLDGNGRQESKKLERSAALAYATESMRLTTRLMQLASWLLLHRAVKEGEMSLAQANKEKTKVKLSATDTHDAGNMELLPRYAARPDRAGADAAGQGAPARCHHPQPHSTRPGAVDQSGRTPARPAQGRLRHRDGLARLPILRIWNGPGSVVASRRAARRPEQGSNKNPRASAGVFQVRA